MSGLSNMLGNAWSDVETLRHRVEDALADLDAANHRLQSTREWAARWKRKAKEWRRRPWDSWNSPIRVTLKSNLEGLGRQAPWALWPQDTMKLRLDLIDGTIFFKITPTGGKYIDVEIHQEIKADGPGEGSQAQRPVQSGS